MECGRFQHLSTSLVQRFTAPDYNLSEFEAIAVQQHYGLPTAVIDCTSNSDTAMKFAIGACKTQSVGRICVIPTEAYLKGLSVIELTSHKWAARAQRQEAFAVAGLGHRSAIDLKSNEARDRWGVRWYDFPITQLGREQAAEMYSRLVSVNDDATAGILRHEVIEYSEQYGKFPPRLATWLVRRPIPMVPRAYRGISVNSDGLVEHIPPCQVGTVDEEYERIQTEKYLSMAYLDDSRERSHWEKFEIGEILVDPRTWHSKADSMRTSA